MTGTAVAGAAVVAGVAVTMEEESDLFLSRSMRVICSIFFRGGVTDVKSLYQTLRFLGLGQTKSHLCNTKRQQLQIKINIHYQS